jgi:Arc/MetJ-type ribon-helix-helix transcriptional regulator
MLPLSPRVSELIGKLITSGTYHNATEAIEDAFDALIERDSFRALCAELNQADEQLASGEYTEYAASTIHELASRVRGRGMTRLAEERRKDAE